MGSLDVKISKLTRSLLVSLLFTATNAAVADSKYPATDFQPKVVYQDTEYTSGSSAASSSSSKAEVSTPDSNYPAANFQPEVLYQDSSYKHTKDKVTSSGSSASVSSSTAEEAVQADDGEDSSLSLVLGLAALVIAGYIFYNSNLKKAAPAKRSSKTVVAASSDDKSISGVAKYLESKVEAKPSSVAKYLEERESSSPVSGVAKYLAKQKISSRIASLTGVEKYLKDRA